MSSPEGRVATRNVAGHAGKDGLVFTRKGDGITDGKSAFRAAVIRSRPAGRRQDGTPQVSQDACC